MARRFRSKETVCDGGIWGGSCGRRANAASSTCEGSAIAQLYEYLGMGWRILFLDMYKKNVLYCRLLHDNAYKRYMSSCISREAAHRSLDYSLLIIVRQVRKS